MRRVEARRAEGEVVNMMGVVCCEDRRVMELVSG